MKMTPFERQVWAAAYGTYYAVAELRDERTDTGNAFERATYAVIALRELKEEGGVFGTPDEDDHEVSESSEIEAEVFKEVNQ